MQTVALTGKLWVGGREGGREGRERREREGHMCCLQHRKATQSPLVAEIPHAILHHPLTLPKSWHKALANQ